MGVSPAASRLCLVGPRGRVGLAKAVSGAMANRQAAMVLVLIAFAGRTSASGASEFAVGELNGAATLPCRNVSTRAVRVEWFHGEPGDIPILFSSEGGLPPDARLALLENSSLHIAGLRWQDEGNYTCREVLAKTNHTHRIQLLVASGPDRVDVNIYPTVNLPNGTLYAKRHDTLNFTCSSDSRPQSTTEWDFNPSGSAQEKFTEANRSQDYFVIHNIMPNYQGNYSCLATNVLSQHQAAETRELLIYYSPPLLPKCWAQTSVENPEMIHLSCNWLGGYPSPSLQWTNPEDLPRDANATHLADAAVLTLNGSGQLSGKEFVCRGRHMVNGEGNQNCTLKLESPLVTSDPMRSCFVGQAVAIACQVSAGNPPARITWRRNFSKEEREIHSGGRFLVSQKGKVSTLVIQNCSSGMDDGYYICKAENPLGLKEVYIRLTVTEPVNIAGIVGTIVVLLLLGILVFSGIFLYAGSCVCPKGNLLRNQSTSDTLVLVDSEDEDLYTETSGELALHPTEGLGNGSSVRSLENTFPEATSSLEETQRTKPAA